MRTKRHGRRAPAGAQVPSQRDAAGAVRLLLAANPLPMWVYDLETLRFLEVNDAAVAHYGYSREEFLALAITDIRPAEDLDRLQASVAQRRSVLQRSGTWRHRKADGALLDVEVTSHLLEWKGRPAALVVAHDVTDVRRLQAELVRRTLYDPTTGLANAALFADRTTEALARARGEGGQVGVLVVGLGDLEAVASTAGDQAADVVVQATLRRLVACCGGAAALARLGGGRFAILCRVEHEHPVLVLASSVVKALAEPVTVPGWGELKSSASVGVALADSHIRDGPSLVRDASSAMRHAAEHGGGHFVLFNAELRKTALESFETEQALAQAARLGQLRLHYQPVVALASGEIVACEALLRWERLGHGLIGPDSFIPLAERSGLIVELGAFVLEHALAEAASWPARTGLRPKVAVNVSAHQLHDEHLVERFDSACATSGLAPSSVCVELTESAFVANDDYDAYRTLAALRATGTEVAIDDFGTGYSTLAYLKHLPVDVIKIDRSFAAGLGVDRADSLLVGAMIQVAHGLGLRVVAEGVETGAQLDVLRELGCDAGQGYLLARPVGSEDLPAALEKAAQTVAR